MRKLILDLETTGLSKNTNRITEIGVIETIDNMPTGNYFHKYLNPEMEVSIEAFKISGLSNEFLSDKPLFKDVVNELDEFLNKDPIVAHNGNFDMGFLNKERELLNMPLLTNELIDTLKIARRIFPGAPCSLDALCKRFKISLYKRDKHGALLDAELLTKIYFFLLEKESTESNLLEQGLLEYEEEIVINFHRIPLIIEDIKDKQLHLELIKKYQL